MFFDQKFERALFLFTYCCHINELILNVTESPDIPRFENFNDNGKIIQSNNIQTYTNFRKPNFEDIENNKLLPFYSNNLQIFFLGRKSEIKAKIRSPGTMHQASCMARTYYSFKICLLLLLS